MRAVVEGDANGHSGAGVIGQEAENQILVLHLRQNGSKARASASVYLQANLGQAIPRIRGASRRPSVVAASKIRVTFANALLIPTRKVSKAGYQSMSMVAHGDVRLTVESNEISTHFGGFFCGVEGVSTRSRTACRTGLAELKVAFHPGGASMKLPCG